MKTYISDKTEKKSSAVNGTGIFARTNIPMGEVVTIKSGDIVTEQQAKALANEIGDYYLQIYDNLFMSPAAKEDVQKNAVFMNHSCEPNVGLVGSIVFVTMRNVKKGEELTLDAAMTSAHQYTIDCNCGKQKCRKIITGQDWRLPELQQRYGQYFSTYILQLIDELKQK